MTWCSSISALPKWSPEPIYVEAELATAFPAFDLDSHLVVSLHAGVPKLYTRLIRVVQAQPAVAEPDPYPGRGGDLEAVDAAVEATQPTPGGGVGDAEVPEAPGGE